MEGVEKIFQSRAVGRVAHRGVKAYAGAYAKGSPSAAGGKAADIDGYIFLGMKHRFQSFHWISGKRKPADEIIAGAGRNAGKGKKFWIFDSVQYLIDGSVSAKDNQGAGFLAGGELSGQRRCLSGTA